MKHLLDFFLSVSRLKTVKRTGWVWRGIRNPETIAEHSFRLTFFAWILGAQSGLRTKKMIEMAMLHDICEAYAGDLTPYYGLVPKDEKKKRAMLQRWIRLPQAKKATLLKKRVSVEKEALMRLVKNLPQKTRSGILSLWADFEYGLSAEGRFVKQIDKIEAMLQGIEYFGTAPNTPVTGWWEEVEELVEHPVLARFVKAIERRLYHNKKTDMDGALDFFLKIGKLKRNPLYIWVVRKVKNPDSEANHAFMLALMAWTFAKEKQKNLNLEKLLKMALSVALPTIFQGKNMTMYDRLLNGIKTQKDKEPLLKKWVRYPIKEKKEIFLARYKKGKLALQKLVPNLEPSLQREILTLWDEFQKNQTSEARFLNQIFVLESLLQGLQYWAKDKRFPIKALWEWAFEFSSDDINLEFMAELTKYFYKKGGRR